ncbi:MAG TPA: ATP-binding protein [Prolixibacteraceae bacterium]
MKTNNPFVITGYISPTYFCDRELETERIVSALKNERNITLLSLRRIGKTGIIKHVFNQLAATENYRLLYLDILPTTCLGDLVHEFGKAILAEEQKRSGNYLKKITKLISGIRGKLTFDQLTGIPELEIDYKKPQEAEKDITSIFQYLTEQNTRYIIAIDEFQQIVNYPEKNVEALLRAQIQQQNTINFIFSGSNKHILSSMFGQYGRPFFQSSDIMNLGRIGKDKYAEFIINHFTNHQRSIGIDLVNRVLDDYDCYTFYIQYFFNQIFATQVTEITDELAIEIAQQILDEREYVYYNYKNLLTNNQFALIKAIAKEGKVERPNAGEFIQKYKLTQASSVNTSLKSLINKDMIYEEGNGYKVYDLFFSKWLARL